MTPFLAALGVIVVVVIAIGLFNLVQGGSQDQNQEVGNSAAGQNDAMQRQSYPDFRKFTCAAEQGTEADFLARQRDSVKQHGERYVDGVSDVRIDGDRATGDVTYHFASAPDDKKPVPTTFVREDGAWKVCSPASS